VKRKFPKALLKNEWGLPYGGAAEVIVDDIAETSRWSEHHDLIFKAPDDGLLYRTYYSKGLTEYQNEVPWEYESEVEATQVEAYEHVIIGYRPVSA
jgi:hypothetical protein